jgi:hypothetical protein
VVSGNLTVDSTTLVVDASNNRVGIGLDNPSVALHVAGGYFIGQPQVAIIEDRRGQNVVGGQIGSSTVTRALNTLTRNDTNFGVTLSNNTFSLPAGTYSVYASVVTYMAGRTRINLINNTTGIILITGQSSHANANSLSHISVLSGIITLASTTTLRIDQFFNGYSADSQNLGVPVNQSGVNEIYASVQIVRFA